MGGGGRGKVCYFLVAAYCTAGLSFSCYLLSSGSCSFFLAALQRV